MKRDRDHQPSTVLYRYLLLVRELLGLELDPLLLGHLI